MTVGGKILGVCIAFLVLLLAVAGVALAGMDKNVLLGVSIVAGVVGIGLAMFAYTTIAGPVDQFAHDARNAASGGRGRMTGRYGPMAETAKSLNTLLEGVSTSFQSLSRMADQLASNASQLASSANQISQSAERQASQAIEVATAMDEMNATVSQVAKNATQVAEQAKVGTELANSGAKVVRQTIESMETISGSVKKSAATVEELGKRSAEIGQIIGVISDIADLTNLLSLNAAIEAARAGEHGRGFAVVADEVRKLAEKTSHATNEVRDTIGSTQKETGDAVAAMRAGTADVQVGVSLASQAEQSLSDIVSSYVTVNDMVHQIATAAEEQSATSNEIARHIDSIAKLSKDVTGGINEIAAASRELAVLSERMRGEMGRMGQMPR